MCSLRLRDTDDLRFDGRQFLTGLIKFLFMKSVNAAAAPA
jgi:hypothetical protein